MSDDRITITGELKLPEGADIGNIPPDVPLADMQADINYCSFMEKHNTDFCREIFGVDDTLAFEPVGYYDADGKTVIAAVSPVRRKP